jgi:hypothetical protein
LLTALTPILYGPHMRGSSLAVLLLMTACSAETEVRVGGVVQEVADPDPQFATPTASFSNAIGGDPTTISYCGASPQAACATAPSAQVRWGVPAFTIEQSGLGFEPAAVPDLEYGQAFDLGTLTHFNFPTIAGTWAGDVTLDMHLRVDPSDPTVTTSILEGDIHIPFTVNETPNDDTPGACPFTPSLTPCSDKITFGTSAFNLGAASPTTIYKLEILGFVNPADNTAADGLISEEYATSSAVLRAKLSESCIDVDLDDVCDEVDTCIGDEVACPPDPCPCDGEWKNHGEYVSCVAHHTQDLVQSGELTHQQRGAIVSAAGRSSCGK